MHIFELFWLAVFAVVILPVSSFESLLLPYGPENGDLFNRRTGTCSEEPFPLGISLAYGKKTFDHVFICKGGFLSFPEGQSGDPRIVDLVAVFWTEDVNFDHWVNPFFDGLCLQMYDYFNAEGDDLEQPFKAMGANFKYYFLPDDVNYGNLCLQKRDEMAVPIEDLVKQDDPRTMRWINGKYNYRNPSFISSKDSLLNGNVFKRVDRSPQTLDFLTSLIRKLPGTGEFEATWSLVVTWLRTALAFEWKGWLSQQTVFACDEKNPRPPSLDEWSRPCFLIWFFEAAALAPCELCASTRSPINIGFYVNGVHHSMPASVNGEMDVDALFGGSNVGVPGLYIFNITGGTPSETQYPAIEGGWSCPREATPNECHLYSHNQQVLTLKGFFCDSAALPTSDAIQIVFQGAFSRSVMRPVKVDRRTGDIEVFCPFWGVAEVAAGYILVDGKEKDRSTFEVLFGSYLDNFGFPPYVTMDALAVGNIDMGWPTEFDFQSNNLIVRTVALKGVYQRETSPSADLLSQDVKLLANNSIAVIDVTSDLNVKYKAVIMQKNFNQMPKTRDELVENIPIIVKSNISCESWIEEQEKINVSHCHKRFQEEHCSSNLCVDHSCPLSGLEFIMDTTSLRSYAWQEDPCCSLSQESRDHLATGGLCDHCELNPGAAFCFYTMAFPCRDSQDTSKRIFHLSHKCCYTDYPYLDLITDYRRGAGGLSLHPNEKHDLARHFKSEIEPWRTCCGSEHTLTTGENSCDAYHRVRPTLISPTA